MVLKSEPVYSNCVGVGVGMIDGVNESIVQGNGEDLKNERNWNIRVQG